MKVSTPPNSDAIPNPLFNLPSSRSCFHLLQAYCTAKFGLVGFTEALYQQTREHSVGATAFCPGIANAFLMR